MFNVHFSYDAGGRNGYCWPLEGLCIFRRNLFPRGHALAISCKLETRTESVTSGNEIDQTVTRACSDDEEIIATRPDAFFVLFLSQPALYGWAIVEILCV